MLQALGISAAAETVYRALLGQPQATPAALAEALAWPPPNVTTAIAELVELALVRPSWEDPHRLRPVPPEVGLEWLVARRQADVQRRQHEIDQARAATQALVQSLVDDPVGTGSRAGPDTLAGLDAVRDRLERIVERTRHEVLAFTPDPPPPPGTLAASRWGTGRLLGRGVRLRTVYLASAGRTAATTAHLHWLVRHGAEVRTRPVLPLRMMVFDRSSVVVPADPTDPAAGAVVLREPAAVSLAVTLFDQEWDRAAAWDPVPSDPAGPQPTELERALLALLLQGETDERVARQLGVSVRTVGRMTADLTGRLGARSRFQAGAYAVARGWLTVPPGLTSSPCSSGSSG